MDERQNVPNLSVNVVQKYHVVVVRFEFQRHSVWECIVRANPDEFFQFVLSLDGPPTRNYQGFISRRDGDKDN